MRGVGTVAKLTLILSGPIQFLNTFGNLAEENEK
jgi:hypothetical protein